MNIGIIGSGGREHSLCYKLKESSLIDKIFCFPGNAGTELIAENINLDVSDFEKIHKIFSNYLCHKTCALITVSIIKINWIFFIDL